MKENNLNEALLETLEKLKENKLELSFFHRVVGVFIELQSEDKCFIYDISKKLILNQSDRILKGPKEYIEEYNEFKQILLKVGFEVSE